MVPPALDLVHANVYCFSDDDKQRLLANLSRCPGGLFMVQDNMSALWPHLFGPEYDNLRSLRTAAASGDTEAVAAMIARGVSMDLPFPDNNNEVSPLAAAVIEFMHDNIGRETIDQLLAAGANPLTALDNRKFGDIFEAKRAELGILGNVAAAVLDSLTSAAGRASLTIRTSLNSLRGSLSLSNSSAASDDSATLAAAAASATVQDGRSMRSKRMARLSFSERGSKGGSAKFATFSLIPPAYRKLFALMDQFLEPESPTVDFLRNHLSDAGGRCFVEWFTHNAQMKSLCGLSVSERNEDSEVDSYTQLKVPNQFLRTPALGFIALEKQLKILDISGNSGIVSTLGPLSKLSNLEELTLKDCTGFHGGLRPLSQLHKLANLSMGNCTGVDGTLEPLGECTALVSIRVYFCTGLSGDLKPVSNLTLLEDFFAMGLNLTGDFAPLAPCTQMRYLKLNGVKGLEGGLDFASEMTDLKEISLCGTGLSGPLDALVKCHLLESVNLNSTMVAGNLEPFRRMTALNRLELGDCPLLSGSPSPISELPELKTLKISSETASPDDCIYGNSQAPADYNLDWSLTDLEFFGPKLMNFEVQWFTDEEQEMDGRLDQFAKGHPGCKIWIYGRLPTICPELSSPKNDKPAEENGQHSFRRRLRHSKSVNYDYNNYQAEQEEFEENMPSLGPSARLSSNLNYENTAIQEEQG
mmetsp:Transcript_34726/g.92570  ORF Transcript_34726/g.92570 Transcript_34726/m.92570 type:complete len:698 (+) Transcript_34726:178-2271(+)